MRFLFLSVFIVACSEYDIKSTVDPNDEIEEIVETLEEESASAPIAVCQVSSPEISPPFELLSALITKEIASLINILNRVISFEVIVKGLLFLF